MGEHNSIGKDTKITIGTVVVILTCLISMYRGVRSDVKLELNTKVDKTVYKSDRENINAKINSLERESIMRYNMTKEQLEEIKELIKGGYDGKSSRN